MACQCPVEQLKTCLFFLFTGFDTCHGNVATAGGLMWFMVPGSGAWDRLTSASSPRFVINWGKENRGAAPSPPLACFIFWSSSQHFSDLLLLHSLERLDCKKRLYGFCFSLCVSHTVTHRTHKQSCFSMFRSRTHPCILPLLAPSCIIFPKLHLSPEDTDFLWAALYK